MMMMSAVTYCQAPPPVSTPNEQEEALSRQQGYQLQDGVIHFLFDPELYGIDRPSRVVVTGAFRNWDANMQDTKWQLQEDATSGVWSLNVPNPQYTVIPPASPFKYRINEGTWMDPPETASNREAGNLIFEPGAEPPRLKAEIQGEKAIWVRLSGTGVSRSLAPLDYKLTDAKGALVPVAAIVPRTSTELLLVPASPIDRRRVYYLEYPANGLKTLCRRDGWFRQLYSTKILGAEVESNGRQTTFRVFAPRAERLQLYLYDHEDDSIQQCRQQVQMQRDEDGVWEATLPGDLHGAYYDFTVHGPVEPGNYFNESHPQHISDPYARVSVDSFGKSRVWRKTTPARPLKHGRPKMQDVVAYEVHVQDFTDQLPVPAELRGTFTAMITSGLKNSRGQPVGFDYLTNLGINVVHLMPVQEFLHYPDAEWQAAFANDPFMIANGTAQENYQWGYRTTHAFAIETRYRQRGSEHGAQRDQFRDLVQAFHDHEMAVIIDLVPNHTGENMDGRHYLFNFNALDLPYYYRTNDRLQHIGPFGNEIKTEDRPMVQRWLLDQCRQLIDEFGIDGFRIDLAGQIDKQTLISLRAALADDVILYGEPWIPASDPEVAKNPDWAWYKQDAPITFFQDDARNAFKGPTSNPQNKLTDRGYAGGDGSQRARVMQALLNSFEDERDPSRGINYLDIHDNWALADQFATIDWDGRRGVDEGPYKIAAGLLFTSLGPIVLHGGSEIMRSKGAAALQETIKHTSSGPLAFHGKRDTYNHRVANEYVWDDVGKVRGEGGSPNDYANMLAYWKGLAELRNSEFGRVFRVAGEPPPDYYHWILPKNPRLLGYLVDRQILVLVNTDNQPGVFPEIPLPKGTWRLIADGLTVNHPDGVSGDDDHVEGGRTWSLTVPATTMKIWLKR